MATRWPTETVVVGIDDSDHSRAALEWACRTVGPGGTVQAVHAASRTGDDDHLARQVDEWISAIDDAPQIVTSSERTGDPSDLLLRTSERAGADLIVVGVHDQRRLTPRRLGGTVRELLRHTNRPLAIVGADTTPQGGNASEPTSVVAGVGEGSATRATMRWAATYAAARGLGLELVRALPNRPVFGADGLLEVMAYYIDPDLARGWAIEDIETLADEIRRSDGVDVPVTMSAPRGSTGPKLVDASRGAALLVLGLHDTDAPEHEVPLWLHHAVTHAPCPVVLVPVAASAHRSD
jgi:nucleotide-binding universal stress UspA family protein